MRAASLRVTLNRSPLLAGVLALAHAGAGACALGYLPVWAGAPLTLAILASLVFHLRRDALLTASRSVTELVLKEADRCVLTLRNGATVHGRVQGSTFVAVALIVINVRVDDRRWQRAVVLLPDAASAEDRRQLRVWLRYRLRPDAKQPEPL
jgi:toxin CptA